jgi:hypothetical protein
MPFAWTKKSSRRATLSESTDRDGAISLQFYDEVAPLVNELGRAMSVALDQNHSAICVVADSTRLMLEEQLTKRVSTSMLCAAQAIRVGRWR